MEGPREEPSSYLLREIFEDDLVYGGDEGIFVISCPTHTNSLVCRGE